jgi:hypothetical protein
MKKLQIAASTLPALPCPSLMSSHSGADARTMVTADPAWRHVGERYACRFPRARWIGPP